MLTTDTTEITFHCSQVGVAVPLSRLELIESSAFITDAIARCDAAYSRTVLNYSLKLSDSEQVVDQDVVVETVRDTSTTTTTYGGRSTINSRYPSYQERVMAYHREVEQLIRTLGLWEEIFT